jgi:hypothetical protein
MAAWAAFSFLLEQAMTTHVLSQQVRFSGAWALVLASMVWSTSAVAGPAEAPMATDSQLSRAEVIADFKLWRRAGVEQHVEAARYYQVDEAAYARALGEYHRLRNSPAFAREVAQAQGQDPASAHADAR